MFEKKYTSLVEGVDLSDPKADSKGAKRVGQYKVSSQAIYKPDGTYLPFRAVTEMTCDKTTVHVSGCCAGGVFVERIIFETDKGKFPFIFDSEKDLEKVKEAMGN